MSRWTSETEIRAYLESISPGRAALPDDPIDRLLHRAELERGFIEHAAAWAAEYGITAAAFVEEGVSPDVLRRAGLPMRGPTSTGGVHEAIQMAIPERQPFSERGLMARTGATQRDVRAVIAEGIRHGTVAEVAISEVEGGGDIRLYRRKSAAVRGERSARY